MFTSSKYPNQFMKKHTQIAVPVSTHFQTFLGRKTSASARRPRKNQDTRTAGTVRPLRAVQITPCRRGSDLWGHGAQKVSEGLIFLTAFFWFLGMEHFFHHGDTKLFCHILPTPMVTLEPQLTEKATAAPLRSSAQHDDLLDVFRWF